MAVIELNKALEIMENRESGFAIQFVTYNKDTGKGGKLMKLNNAERCGAKFSLKENDMIAIRDKRGAGHPYPVHKYLITEFEGMGIII